MHSITGPYPEYNRRKPSIKDIYKVEAEDVTEPVTLTDMKAYLKVDFDDDDAVITDLISACRAALEEFCAISIVPKTITLTAEWGGEWELPYGPVTEVTSVESRTSNTYETQTVDENYYLDGESFLSLRTNSCARSKIIYETGYTTVPKDLILDLKRIVAYCYVHRGDEAMTSLQSGLERPKSMDQAMELFASKHVRMLWL